MFRTWQRDVEILIEALPAARIVVGSGIGGGRCTVVLGH
jgi:hypothetical protein